MKKIMFLASFLVTVCFAQNLPFTWSQSYSTYDLAQAIEPAAYSLGFGIDNYCIYSPDNDTVAYDERRFDILAKLGLLDRLEFEIKYSYPTSGQIAVKYQFADAWLKTALKLGIGYMKGTRIGYITDYVYDFYPTLLITKSMSRSVNFYWAPKIIYSVHARDRQEHSERAARHIFQYGHGLGLALGNQFRLLLEVNWLFGDNEGTKYTVDQFGMGVILQLH